MGDKSPKANQKHKAQQQAKAKSATQKKQQQASAPKAALSLLLFLLSRAFGFGLLLRLVLLIRFRRFVAHDEKGSSCNPQSQRGGGPPRLLPGAGRSLTCSLSVFWLAKEDQVNENA